MLTSQALLQHIRSVPELDAAFSAGHTSPLVAWYASDSGQRVDREAYLTRRQLVSLLGLTAAASIYAALRMMQTLGPNPTMQQVVQATSASMIESMLQEANQGVNMGDPEAKHQITSFVSAGVLTQDQADVLTDWATRPTTRAEAQFGEGVVIRDSDIHDARKL